MNIMIWLQMTLLYFIILSDNFYNILLHHIFVSYDFKWCWKSGLFNHFFTILDIFIVCCEAQFLLHIMLFSTCSWSLFYSLIYKCYLLFVITCLFMIFLWCAQHTRMYFKYSWTLCCQQAFIWYSILLYL